MIKITTISLSILLAISSLSALATDTNPGFDIPRHRVTAPEFSLPDITGRTDSLEHYRGKVVLLNFWATWCPPCREEMPSLQALHHSLKDEGLVILAVAADRGNKKGIIDFATKQAVGFPVLLDPAGDVRNTYEVTGLPMSYLIGRDGKITARIFGALDWTDPEVETFIRERLMEMPAAAHQVSSAISEL